VFGDSLSQAKLGQPVSMREPRKRG